jgi:lysozyme
MTDYDALKELRREEGCRLEAYQDSEGIWTIGVGRNLQVMTISQDQADKWEREDYQTAVELAESIPEYPDLSRNRKRVICQMTFQLGLGGIKKFRKMWMAIREEDWQDAHAEMLDSRWAFQTPGRARRMADRMMFDNWPE